MHKQNEKTVKCGQHEQRQQHEHNQRVNTPDIEVERILAQTRQTIGVERHLETKWVYQSANRL